MWVPVIQSPLDRSRSVPDSGGFYQAGFDYDSKKDTTQWALTPDLKQMLINPSPQSRVARSSERFPNFECFSETYYFSRFNPN